MAGSEALASQSTGFNSLFIGHSFFRPFADGMPFHTAQAGIVDHTQTVVFSGGASGAPQALWENASKRAEIQAVLDGGDIELFGMTYHGAYPTTEGYENWFDYALAQNPDTRFFIGLPWADFPENDDAATYASFWLSAHATAWHDFIGSLRELYPHVEIFCIPYGQSALELRNLFVAGNLPDVSVLTGNSSEAIFTDTKGHAGQILKDLGRLVWLRAIYDVDLMTYAWDPGYITDLKGIAQAIMDEHDAAHPEPPTAPEISPIRATRFTMRDDTSPPINTKKRRFSFRSSAFKGNPSGVVAPAFGEAGDPTPAGASGGGGTLTIYRVSGDADDAVRLDLPASRWEQSGSPARPGYRYKDTRLEDGPISKIRLRNGTLTIAGKGEGLYTLDGAPQGRMALRLELGSGSILCAAAGAKDPANKNDSTARFIGEQASPAPDPCPPVNPASSGSAALAFLAAPTSLLD
ncbi:MAG: hypothetical protein ABGY42_16375 [bacterium]